jgi:alpha-amylase/alpha-mannosidase (GH57 family)
MTRRHVVVHGHFYQPPRESPWLEVVEAQSSAAPFHDWNERVHAECYAPNAAARILDPSGRVDRLVNNYAGMSFDAGPTLLAWMEQHDPVTYAAILEADRRAVASRGHGVAIAQVHGHLILPLCNERDRRTQVRWGARDFELRFGRRPKGMWLAETAVDHASLEALVDEGIAFTILAPHQCASVRPKGSSVWADVTGARVDPRRAYEVPLPSGRRIVVFFYDGPVSRSVAFEHVLDDGKRFADRIMGAFSPVSTEPQIVHLATDGESYGHHHRFGEMALAYALEHLAATHGRGILSSYEEFLAAHPPHWEAEIVPNTSWSCAHGIERWRSHCGCHNGAPAGWTQAWRGPMRAALDDLRDAITPEYEREGARLFRDPWAARDAYVDVLVDPSAASRARFFGAHGAADALASPGSPDRVRALSLLEMQRHAMSMYTSCGWFFNDVSGIEAQQCLAYAARVIDLATELFGDRFRAPFLARLAEAKSNLPSWSDGRRVFEQEIMHRRVPAKKAAAHFAITSLFTSYGAHEQRYGYDVEFVATEQRRAARARLAFGRLLLRHERTEAHEEVDYAVVHLGDHNLGGGVRPYAGDASHKAMREDLSKVFARLDLPEVLRALDRHFPGEVHSLRSIFHDEQRRILDGILRETLDDVAKGYQTIYEQQVPLMRYLTSIGQAPPREFEVAAEMSLGRALERALSGGRDIDLVAIDALAKEAHDAGVPLAMPALARAMERTLRAIVESLHAAPSPELVSLALDVARFASANVPFDATRCQHLLVRIRDAGAVQDARFGDLCEALGVARTKR